MPRVPALGEAVEPERQAVTTSGCRVDEQGRCVEITPCGANAPYEDDCLGEAEPAWASQISLPVNIDKDLTQSDAPDDEYIYWSN